MFVFQWWCESHCFTHGVKKSFPLEKRVLLLLVKNKLHARNSGKYKKTEEEASLHHLKRHVALWKRLLYITIYIYVENYIILRKYIKYVFSPLTEVVGPTMNLIRKTHHFCERREYAFNVLPATMFLCFCAVSDHHRQS